MPLQRFAKISSALAGLHTIRHCKNALPHLHSYIVISFLIFAFYNANGQKRKISNGFEFVSGIGISTFSGDLGSDGPLDLNSKKIGISIGGGARYYFTNKISMRTVVNYVSLRGDDSLSSNAYRKFRNLDFKANVFDFSLLFEYSLVNWNFRGEWSRSNNYSNRHNIYIFGGLSLFHFHPYGNLDGNWHSLPQLSTAGQGLPGGPAPYKLSAVSFPAGLGYKILVENGFSIGIELVYHKTFTDYIDDVSAPYYDNTLLKQYRGDIAAAIADKNTGGTKRPHMDPRGSPGNPDNFSVLKITFNQKLGHRKKGNSCYIY